MRATATISRTCVRSPTRGRSSASTASTSPTSTPTPTAIETLLALLEEGYGDRIHLSHDGACFYDFMVGDPNFADERPDYLHLSTKILPVLRERGVTAAQIDELTIDNPRRFLDPTPLAA